MKTKLVAIGAAGLLAAGATGVAVVSTAGASTGTIYGCVATAGSKTINRVTSQSQPVCASGYVPIQWQGAIGAAPPPTPSPTPTSPSPSPTSPSPSPSQSSSPPPSGACVTSNASGSCGPYSDAADISASNGSNTYVANNIWNDISGTTQTLTAISPSDWSVKANMPLGNTAVVSYPETSQLYTTAADTPDPLSNFTSIQSSYTDSGFPASATDTTDAEWAYDIWEGTGSSNYAQEIMIWTDNHGQRPAGNQVASATIGGVSYQVWSTGAAGAVGNPVTLVANSQGTSGSVDLLAALNWLVTNGYSPAGSGLNMIDYGPELCSTGGADQTYGLSAYTLTTAGG